MVEKQTIGLDSPPSALERVQHLPMLDSARPLIEAMIAHDETLTARSFALYMGDLERLYVSLGGTERLACRWFVRAWWTLISAVTMIDHLQDDDPDPHPILHELPNPLQYQLAFTYFALASAVLDPIDETSTDGHIRRHLRRLWNDGILLLAAGQIEDLQSSSEALEMEQLLHRYAELADAKTGKAFALLLGGTALLAGAKQHVLDLVIQVGTQLGCVIQMADDYADDSELTAKVSLPTVYEQLRRTSPDFPDTMTLYLEYLMQQYATRIEGLIDQLPMAAQSPVRDLIRRRVPRVLRDEIDRGGTA